VQALTQESSSGPNYLVGWNDDERWMAARATIRWRPARAPTPTSSGRVTGSDLIAEVRQSVDGTPQIRWRLQRYRSGDLTLAAAARISPIS